MKNAASVFQWFLTLCWVFCRFFLWYWSFGECPNVVEQIIILIFWKSSCGLVVSLNTKDTFDFLWFTSKVSLNLNVHVSLWRIGLLNSQRLAGYQQFCNASKEHCILYTMYLCCHQNHFHSWAPLCNVCVTSNVLCL